MISTSNERKVLTREGNLKENNDIFVLIEASKLKLNDSFMKYDSNDSNEMAFKEMLIEAISHGHRDFYVSRFDPYYDGKTNSINFKPFHRPAVGRSYKWWLKKAMQFAPDSHSRLGTKNEYVLFLGVLIKKLVEKEGWSVKKAWNAVCIDSRELGHYKNSENAKSDFERTGSREVCGFFDLANTWKILQEDEASGGFWLGGGDYIDRSNMSPLATLIHDENCCKGFYSAVGWIVLE